MRNNNSTKRVAILVADGFEQEEMTRPREALEQAGFQTEIISSAEGQVKGWQHDHWGDTFQVDAPLAQAKADRYDALFVPGGVMSPDRLRQDKDAQRFVQAFAQAGKPIGALCHGPWVLIDAGVAQGRQLTSYHSIQNDLKNAGARWVDREVVVDHGLVTSRGPDDIPAFNRKLVEEIREGTHQPV